MSQERSRTVRFVQNTLSTAIYQITAMMLGMITPRLMMLYYGSGVNGVIVSITDFLSYFRMVEAGLAATAMHALYQPLADKDDSAISSIVSAARTFYLKVGWIFSALTIVFALIYPLVVPVTGLEGELKSTLSVMLLILAMGVSGAFEFFTLSRYRVLLNADQRAYIISLISMVTLMLSTLFIVALPYIGADVVIVQLCVSLTIVIRPIFLSRYVAKHYPRIDAYAKPNVAAMSGRKDALIFELTQILTQGAGVILATLITRDTLILSVYGVYHMVTIGLGGILKMGTTGVYAIFGNLIVSGDRGRFQRAYRDFECLFQLICAVLFGVATVLIVPFVNLYTHGINDANYNLPILGFLIILDALTYQCRIPLDLMVSASGAFRDLRKQSIWQVAITFVLGTALGLIGFQFGTVHAVCGIVAAVCIANIVRLCTQLAYVPRRIIGLPWQLSARRMLGILIVVLLISVPCLLLISPPQRFFTWVMYAAVLVPYGAAIALAVAWLFDREALKSLISRLRNLLSR
ncbi:MAG: hypothetical protein GX096_13095 [Clostridiales bacterium]|nr:hypothetical protein [Clostridiales bacterium]